MINFFNNIFSYGCSTQMRRVVPFGECVAPRRLLKWPMYQSVSGVVEVYFGCRWFLAGFHALFQLISLTSWVQWSTCQAC